jgi:hypothetical protein
MESIRKLLYDLEKEISSEKFIKLYETIREKYPSIKFCLAPQDLISCLHNQDNPDYQLNDEILSSLILEYQSYPESKPVSSYLLIIFKPGLLKLFSQFRLRARQFSSVDESDLWLQIITLFFEELSQLDPNKDKRKIASKILGKLRNKLRDYFTSLFKELNSEQELNAYPEAAASSPSQIDPQEIYSLLEDLVKSGVISGTDKYILLATEVYGKSMKDLSRDLEGISYVNIRQRKARTQRIIRAHLKKSKNTLSQFGH